MKRRYLLEQIPAASGRNVWTLFIAGDSPHPGDTDRDYAAMYVDATMHPDIEWDDDLAKQWATDVLTSQGVTDLDPWRPLPGKDLALSDAQVAYVVTGNPR